MEVSTDRLIVMLERALAGDPPLSELTLRAASGVLARGDDWAITLAATIAESCGARAIVTPVVEGVSLAFAGLVADAERAEEAWLRAMAACGGRSPAWRAGFAAELDDALDAVISDEPTRARVARVARWLAAGGVARVDEAPLLLARGAPSRRGARAARTHARGSPRSD